MQQGEHLYEVSYIIKKGDFPLITHVAAKSEEEAKQKILESKKPIRVIEAFII